MLKILVSVFLCDKNGPDWGLGLSGGKSKPRVWILYSSSSLIPLTALVLVNPVLSHGKSYTDT